MRFWNVCILTKCVRPTSLIWTDSGSGLSKYSKKSENFRKGTPVDKERRYENVPNYSVFYFRDRRYIFAKLLENPKLLPKRMALLVDSRGTYIKNHPVYGIQILIKFLLCIGFLTTCCSYISLGEDLLKWDADDGGYVLHVIR